MFYGFLFATLPTLRCGAAAEISLAEFDELAGETLSEKRFKQLISWDSPDAVTVEVYRAMREFDAFLKLRIAEERQEKLGVFSGLPQPEELFSDVDFALPVAAASGDPLERERLVDLIRWRKIDDLETGHELDFTALCCYRMRLSSLEKYRRRLSGEGSAVFEQTVDALSQAIGNI